MQNLTQLIGHTLITLESVDSTNNYIANHAELDNMAHGTVVLAWEQTVGRGRFTRNWEADKGLNLTFSYLLFPTGITYENYFLLSKLAAVSICEWLKKLGLQPKIKIPNDVIINQKKISGILIENKWQGKNLVQQIAGIGINVNQDIFNTYYKIEPTSVKLETGIDLDLKTAINDLLNFFSHHYVMLSENENALDSSYDKFLIKDYLMDEEDRIQLSKILNNGTVHYFDDNGFNHEKLVDDFKLQLLKK